MWPLTLSPLCLGNDTPKTTVFIVINYHCLVHATFYNWNFGRKCLIVETLSSVWSAEISFLVGESHKDLHIASPPPLFFERANFPVVFLPGVTTKLKLREYFASIRHVHYHVMNILRPNGILKFHRMGFRWTNILNSNHIL